MRPLLLLLVPAALRAQMIMANPCTLLTPAEVLSATQDSVTRTALTQNLAPECTYATSDSNAKITIKIETTRDYADKYWDMVGDSILPIPSLGDRALVMGTNPPVTRVLRRDHVYTITYTNITMQPEAIRNREKRLAMFAIARAP